MASIQIGSKQLEGHGSMPYSHKEVEVRKVKKFLKYNDIPTKVFESLPESTQKFLIANKEGIPAKDERGKDILKQIAHKNVDEVIFQCKNDIYIASSDQLHLSGHTRGIGKVVGEGDKINWNGKDGEVIHVGHERDQVRKVAKRTLMATVVGLAVSAGLGFLLPVAIPIVVVGGTATVVTTAAAPAWLLTLKGVLPFVGGATGALSAVLGSVKGWFRRDRSGIEAISDLIKDSPAPAAKNQKLLVSDTSGKPVNTDKRVQTTFGDMISLPRSSE